MQEQYKSLKLHQMLGSSRLGGAEKLAFELHKYAVTKQAGESRLIVPRNGFTEKITIEQGFSSLSYNLDWLLDSRRCRSLLSNLDIYLRMLGHSRGILHIHSPFVYGALKPLLSLSPIKTVLHLHLDYTEDELRWPLRVVPDLIIACASFIKPTIERLLPHDGPKRTKISVILNAVDINRFHPSDRAKAKMSQGINPEIPILLIMANLARHKGQETAIRTLSILKAQGHHALLWVVGEERESGDEYGCYLRALAGGLGVLDSVEFLGFRTDIPELLHAADFLLLPSTREGLPLAILEAQASKLVVLSAPTAGIPEVIRDGRTGFLIHANDPEGYARQIAFLLKDKDAASQVADEAFHQVASGLTISHYCDKVFKEYQMLS